VPIWDSSIPYSSKEDLMDAPDGDLLDLSGGR
jgi:hypothetical protein